MRGIQSKAVVVGCGSAAVILGLAAALIALSSSGTAPHPPSNPNSNPKRTVVDGKLVSNAGTEVPASLRAAFHDLRRPGGAADAIPSGLFASFQSPGSPAARFGGNPSQARRVGESDGAPLWLVPGATGSCLLESDGGSVCGTNTDAEFTGLQLARVPVNGGPPTVIGVLPDGATVSTTATNGTVHEAPVAGAVYTIAGTDATKFTIRTGTGKTFPETMPGGAPTTGP